MFALHFVKGIHPEVFKENVSLFIMYNIYLWSCGVLQALNSCLL